MFCKINVLKIFRNLKTYRSNPWRKTLKLKELFLAKLQAFYLQLFLKMNIYAGRFQDSNCFKKTHFKKHFWMAASVKSSTFNLSTFRCVVIISVSNDISEFTENLSGSNKVHYPISNRNDFTVVITSVVGRQLYWCKMSSLHYIWCFSSKIAFVNWDKSAGICGLVQTNELNF